jgi:hypothetical protein
MELYSTSEQEKKRINSSFNVTEEEIAEKFKLLKEWVESTPHLPLESKGKKIVQKKIGSFAKTSLTRIQPYAPVKVDDQRERERRKKQTKSS